MTLWYTLLAADRVGRISPGGGIEEFPLSDRSCRPHAIAATTDGGCWATLWAASSVVRIDRDGHLVEQATFPPGAEPHGIALAPDETLWVALETGSLAHLDPGRRSLTSAAGLRRVPAFSPDRTLAGRAWTTATATA